MQFSFIWAPVAPQIWMQIFVVVTMLYLLWKYSGNLLSLCLIFLSYPRVFDFFGKTVFNSYKIFILAFVAYLFIARRTWNTHTKKDYWLTGAFVVFVTQFLLATFLYSTNTLTIIFSQLARYVEVYMLYFIAKDAIINREEKDLQLKVLYDIVLMNIFISIFKWLIFQVQIEGLVGSLAIIGGAQGTSLPIVGFVILWLYRKGRFDWFDWLYVVGLLFIGFTTGKRAVMFILPVVVAAFMVYVNGMKMKRYMWVVVAVVPFLFYFGVRLTPTLNLENRVWGSFNWDYAFGYAEKYQFGQKGIEGQAELIGQEQQVYYEAGTYGVGHGRIESEGRGGATIALLKLIFGIKHLTDQDLWGIGFKNMYGIDYETFDRLPLTIHVRSKGDATGLFQSYVTTGVFGVFTTVFFCFMPFFFCQFKRLRLVLLGIVTWEYFMYTGFIFRTPMFMAALIFVILYVNNERALNKVKLKEPQPNAAD